MIVAAAEIDVRLPQAHSLKERRRVLESAVQRLRLRFPVAIVQLELPPDARWASLGLVALAGQRQQAEAVRERAVAYLERLLLAEAAEVVRIERELR